MDDKRYNELNQRIIKLEKTLCDISVKYQVEKAKTEIYREIIEKNSTILLEKKVRQRSIDITEKHVKKTPVDSNINIIKDDHVSDAEMSIDDSIQPVFTDTVVITMDDIIYPLIDEEQVDQLFEKIKTVKSNGKYITALKQLRNRSIGSVGNSDYIELCKKHLDRIVEILEEKSFTEKKINSTIMKCFSTVELRFLRYGTYYNETIDIDDMNRLREVLCIWNGYSTEYVPYDSVTMRNDLCNYGALVDDIQTNVTRVLVNIHGFSNVIYVKPVKKSKHKPFSFYYLDEIKNDQKFWKMDCDLENLTITVTTCLTEYLIRYFRILYKDVFKDNDYRSEYREKCNLTECDLQKTIRNIFMLCDHGCVKSILKQIIMSRSTYVPDESDNFNILTYDQLQTKHVPEFTVEQICKRLFDTLSDSEVRDITTNGR